MTLTWPESCVLTAIATQTTGDADPNTNHPVKARERIDAPTNATFNITDTKLYVPVVTLSEKDDCNVLEQLESGFKRTIKWNKYRSEMTNLTKTNHLNHLIEHLFKSIIYQKLERKTLMC